MGVDAARLADELRAEQEHAQTQEKMRKALEVSTKELQTRLEDVENNAMKAGKKALAKLETRVRELESQLDNEARRHSDSQQKIKTYKRQIEEAEEIAALNLAKFRKAQQELE